MNQTHRRVTATGSLLFVTAVTAGGLVTSSLAGDVEEYFDVTTVFVAEEGYGGGGHDMDYYGESDGVGGWAVGTTSCNRGNIVAPWFGGTDNTPVIAQNCYRYADGRFEQIGMSWLKHSFCAVSEPGCTTWDGGGCQETGCNTLGIGCADTYWAGLNADADAPRSEINAYTGIYAYPFTIAPSGPSSIRGKLQIDPGDIDPDENPNARYFVEGQYVEPNEYVFGVHMNNASYKEIGFPSVTSSSGVGETRHMIPGIYAWPSCVSGVVIGQITTVEEDGGNARGHIGFRVSANGDGTWHYEYAIHNQNSHRSFQSFTVPVPDCVTLFNVEFHDVDYHSGEVIDGTDWAFSRSSDSVTWSTETFDDNPNANAIRWATMYNFRFDADTPPITESGFLDYFRSGPEAGVSVDLRGPSPDCGAPSGACCVGDNCQIDSEADCVASGGTFLGVGVSCDGNPCYTPPIIGACCLAGGNCSVITQDECTTSGGLYQGDDSDCGQVTCDNTEVVQVVHAIVGSGNLSIDDPNWTVDVYAAVGQGFRVDAVAGNNDQQKMITSTYGFYQDPGGGPTSLSINPAFYEFTPDLEWDTRVTIGALDQTGDPYDANTVQDVGIDWEVFESGGDLSAGDGTWFVLPDEPQGEARLFTAQDCSQRYGVLVARLTAMDLDSTVMFEALVQGRDAGGNTWQDTVSYTFGYEATEDCNGNQVPDSCDIANGTSQDSNGNGVPDECDNSCPGDADGDGDSDVDDILAALGNFGGSGSGDVDSDGDVDVDDLLLILSYFGNC
ncbi:MAG: hypothetical protein MK116_06590 [Phycisphaerales bacterium]|nr:hypothetical protein [Phycisphaerales bacterium]